jgi:hypothetical protein
MKIQLFILLMLSIACQHKSHAQKLQLLESGASANSYIFEESSKYRRATGFAIVDFRVTKDGTVDSCVVESKYYVQDNDLTNKLTTKKDIELLKSLKFVPTDKPYWVSLKIYTFYYTSSYKDPYDKTRADRMRYFDYGFEELYENELKSFFTDKTGENLDFIIKDDKVILAPIYIKKIT